MLREIKEIIIGSVLTLSGAVLMIGGDETIIIGAVIGALGLALLLKLFASGYHGCSDKEESDLQEEQEKMNRMDQNSENREEDQKLKMRYFDQSG